MTNSRLHEDLMKDFQDQKISVKEQMELIEPLVATLHQPAYKRMLHSGFSVFLSILLWIAAAGLIVYAIFYYKLPPFDLLKPLISLGMHQGDFTDFELNAVAWSVQGLIILIAVLLAIVARMLARIREKNVLLHAAAKGMKQLAEAQLKRKAAIESIEQRYLAELPTDQESIELPPAKPASDISFDEISS